MAGFGKESKHKKSKVSNKNTKSSHKNLITQAVKFHLRGDVQKAAEFYQYFINQGFQDYRVFSNYGIILNDLGKLKEAELLHRKAIELKPNSPDAYSNLGNVLRDFGKLKEAELSYRKAIELKPNFPDAYSNLGNVLRDFGKLKEAELSYRKAIELKPNFPDAYSNLGNVLRDFGKLKEAELSYRKAIELKPNFPDAYSDLGTILKDLGKLKEAELSFRKAIELKPNFPDAYSNLGTILKDLGKSKEAYNIFQKCLVLDPNDLGYNIQARLFISSINSNQLQIEKEREELNRQISLIGNNTNIIYKNNHLPSSIDFIFYLAYHNCNDKEILKNIAHNLSKKDKILNTNFNLDHHIKESLARKKIRLAICSSFFFEHSVTRCWLNIIEDFTKNGVEVIILRNKNDKIDKITEYIISLADETISLPQSLEESCQIILNSSFDVLFYLDLGMSLKTYFMSLSRLALVQVVINGHPNTSGSPNIDYFISSKDLETENSDQYYSERLIKLTRLPVNYSLPKIINSNFKVSKLNISDDDFIIGLPHTSFKYHPDFDYILDKILEEIPHARLLFFEGTKKYETNKLLSRWKQNSKNISNRIIICPRVEFDDYLTIAKRFDIILDPFYCGMGNTFYQAMALGTPVLSMTASQARGKNVYAGYKQMGIKSPPIAKSQEEYILLCKKLAFDNKYRENIRNQILDNAKDKLFNDKHIYKQFIDFFEKALEAAYKKELLPIDWEPVSINYNQI